MRLKSLLLASALFLAGPAFANDTTPLIGIFNQDNVPLCAGAGQAAFAGCVATIHPMGLLFTTTATSSTTTGTSEQTLVTYSLPANTLDAVGRKLRIRCSFSAAANADNKTFKLYFGSEVITSGVLTTNNKNGNTEMYVTKTGASTQIVSATMSIDTTPITPYVVTNAAETDTSAIVIKFTGTDGTSSAGDIVANDCSVEYMN